MEVCLYPKCQLGRAACYILQTCVIGIVNHHWHWYGLSHIRLHAASYSCSFLFYVTFLHLRQGSYCRWLRLQHRSVQIGVCIHSVSCHVVCCLKRLWFGSIWPQWNLVAVFLKPWLHCVERCGRWSRNQLGRAADYMVSYQSKWNEWQWTCTVNSCWILLCIVALLISAEDTNSRTMCSKLVWYYLFVYSDTSRWMTAEISRLIHWIWTIINR